MTGRDRLAFNTLANFTDYGARIVVSLVMFPFLLRTVGTENLGIYVLISSFSGYLGLLDLGITQAVTREVSLRLAQKGEGDLNRTTSSAFLVLIAVGVIALLICVASAPVLASAFNLTSAQRATATVLVQFLGISLLFGFAENLFRGILAGHQRYDLVAVVGILDTAARAVAVVAVIVSGATVVELTFWSLLASQAAPLLAAFLVKRQLPKSQIALSLAGKDSISHTVRFGGVLTYMTVAGLLVYQTDAIILGVYAGALALGYYSVAQRINLVLRQVDYLLPSAVMPAATELNSKGEPARLRRLILEGTLYSNALLAPAAMIVVVMADPLVRSWVGAEMVASVPLVQFFTVYLITYSAENFLWQAMIGVGTIGRLVPYITVLVATNLGLSLALTAMWGPIGVVLGTCLSYVALHPWYLWVTLGEFKIPVQDFLKGVYFKVLPIGGAVAIALALLQHTFPSQNFVQSILYCATAYGLALGAIYRFSFSLEERARVRTTVKGLVSRLKSTV